MTQNCGLRIVSHHKRCSIDRRACRFSQALNRVKQPLFSLCRHSDPEIALVGLCHVCLLVQQTPYAFSDDYQQFFVRQSDAPYVKQKKIDVLKYLATDSNQMILVNELMEYTKVQFCAVHAARVPLLL